VANCPAINYADGAQQFARNGQVVVEVPFARAAVVVVLARLPSRGARLQGP
jgi:hypothetical protein